MTTKQTTRKMLAMLLAICLTLTMLPMTAAAAETAASLADTINNWAPAHGALTATAEDDTVTVTGTVTDTTETLTLDIADGVTVKWGASLSGNYLTRIKLNGGTFELVSGGAVITNSDCAIETNSCDLIVSGGTIDSGGVAILAVNCAVTVSGGEIEGRAITEAILADNCTVTVSSGNINNPVGTAIGAKNGSTVTVSGGTVSTDIGRAIYVWTGSKVTVSGGIVKATEDGTAIEVDDDSTVNISETAQVTSVAYDAIRVKNNSVLTVSGGTVSGGAASEWGPGVDDRAIFADTGCTVNISGGTVEALDNGTAIEVYDSEVNISSGTVKAEINAIDATTSEVNISGGSMEADVAIYIDSLSTVTVSGGPVTARGESLAFNKTPTIVAGLEVAEWSKNTDGTPNESGAIDWTTAKYVKIAAAGGDTTPPMPGSSGTISTASVTDTSLTLNWTKATDNTTAQPALKYYVYRSASDNIDTVENCADNGTLLNSGGTADIATLGVTGLTVSTTYYFNVVVEDAAGNKAAYTMISKATSAAQTEIVISNQSDWDALIANTSPIPASGGVIKLNADVTGSLIIPNLVQDLTIDGGAVHTITGSVICNGAIDLTLKNLNITAVPISNVGQDALTFSGGSSLTTVGTVALTGSDSSVTNAGSGVLSNSDLTITAGDGTTFKGGSSSSRAGTGVYIFGSGSDLTLNGGSPTFKGGNGAGGYGITLAEESLGDLIITSGSPKFEGGIMSSGYGISGASIGGDLIISSSGSPRFTGADGNVFSMGAHGAWVKGNLAISTGTPVFTGGAATSGTNETAGYGVQVEGTMSISGSASPTFTGGAGNAAASTYGGYGAFAKGTVTVSTSGTAAFMGGANGTYGLYRANDGTLDLSGLSGKFIAVGDLQAIRTAGTITYPTEIAELSKYDGTAASYTLDIASTQTYTITFNPGGGTVSETTRGITQGAAIGALPTPTRSGSYRFDGWFTAASGGTQISAATVPAGSVTYYAHWTDTSGSSGGGTGGVTNTDTVVEDTTIKGTAVTKNSDGSVTLNNSGTIEVDGTVTVDTPAGTVVNKDGSVAIPEGKTAKVTLADKETTVTVSGGTTVGSDGTITVGSGTASISLASGTNIAVSEGAVIAGGSIDVGPGGATITGNGKEITVTDGATIILDESVPLGCYVVCNNAFADVAESAWYNNAVSYVYTYGIMKGVGGNAFDPQATLDRAMMVQILWNLAGNPTSAGAGFDDVDSGAWYASAVAWAAEAGITSGIGNNLFAPGSPITREQMAVMLYNYCKFAGIELPSVNESGSFADAGSISSWALDATEAMYKAGILSGKGNGVFDPKGTATRAQVAQMMINFMETVK